MSNKHTLKDYFTAISSGDDYQAYYADDIVWQLPGSHPYGAEHRGLADVRHMLERSNRELVNISSMTFEFHEMIEEGNKIAVRMTQVYNTVDGDQRYSNEYLDIFEFRDGKIVRITASFDTYRMDQLGLYNTVNSVEV